MGDDGRAGDWQDLVFMGLYQPCHSRHEHHHHLLLGVLIRLEKKIDGELPCMDVITI